MEESESVPRVLYETSVHASRPYSSNYPPQQTKERAQGGGFLSLLSVPGVSQFREKWSGYRNPKKLKKCISLFISRSGERVAVASGNQITFLRKEDDYQEPFGIFTSNRDGTFNTGAWSESHDVLGVLDDTDTLYFIKANGEELRRITTRELKVSLPIIGLIAQDDSDIPKPTLCSFIVVTSDGSLQHTEISQKPGASNSVLNLKRPLPNNIFCLDYQSEPSLFAVVSSSFSGSLTSSENSGSSYLSLWRRRETLDLEQLCCTQFEGNYTKPKGYNGPLAYPKVLISPNCKFVATLGVTGCVHIFKVAEECRSISTFVLKDRGGSQLTDDLSSGGRNVLSDNMDFTWWSDDILTLGKSSGIVTMVDISSDLKAQESNPVYTIPVLERVRHIQGHIFLLATALFEERHVLSKYKEAEDLHNVEWITEDRFDQCDISSLRWSLISFSERSIPDMYNILISKKEYQAAMNFADCHGLDKDEVLKAQWLSSGQGLHDIKKFLSNVKDQVFVISECVDKVGPTEDAVKALLAYGLRQTNQYRFSELEDNDCSQTWDFRMARLQLLQFRDRLETYLGINMGRFSMQEYSKFRVLHISEAATALAESGKIGALNLLFKRHPYSLASSMLEILAAVPETVPVPTYGQLLPGRSPPAGTAVREEDWVECEKMVGFVNRLPENHEVAIQIKTEPMVKRIHGSFWPSVNELSLWYKNRARDIDSFSGQLDNCLSLVDFACRKGIYELRQFHEDILYLHRLVYSEDSDGEMNISISLVAWEQLSDYEKFRMMLKGVSEENVIERLRDDGIPFMQKRCRDLNSTSGDEMTNNQAQSFLVNWLRELAVENRLDLCLIVIDEGSKNIGNNSFLKDEVEAVDCGLQCIYSCTAMDKWNTMASILSKLPQNQGYEYRIEGLGKRVKLAEGHIEAGRLLAFYQVPKPANFFLEAHTDEKGVKQIIRLILSKFIRKQPGRSDNDWANMWRDMQCLREKAFPFLDLEYMLMEYCRGLLKAGKFSLARNYLKGTSSVALASDKAENLVIQAAREYFFSASSLACSEIWKAKECLNIFPSSRNVKAEADIIEALTVKLPNLGVIILPMQFRQIKDPMEIIKMAISSQAGAYLDVDDLIEVSKLLGLSSPDEISAVEEAIAREAAVAGDLQLAFDLCLGLAKKGHGLVWDLCAAIARGPALDNMDTSSRKHLLGFALSHCDEESVGELLHAWKDLDLQGQCETLMMLTGTDSPNLPLQDSPGGSFTFHHQRDGSADDLEVNFSKVQNVFSAVAKTLPDENGTDCESILKEDAKISSFSSVQLPWLHELSREAEHIKKLMPGKQYGSVRIQAIVTILSWLARNGFAPKDNLIAALAKAIIEPPVTEEEDVMGCSFLLNLVDAFSGVEIIEQQLRNRKDYQEICSIMNVGMIYSLLHTSGVQCEGPAQRRELLLKRFKEKHSPLSSEELDKFDKVQSTFWREWKLKIEEQKRVADHSRTLQQIIPGVDTARFLSGDSEYIESVVLSLIESVKSEKKRILKDVLRLVQNYNLNRSEVLLQYLCSILISEIWTNDDIAAEISEVKREILGYASRTITALSSIVYPAINGCNKQRLTFVFSLLSGCYLQLEETREPLPVVVHPNQAQLSSLELARLYQVIEQECARVSFIKDLNFKNIAGLGGLNLECFHDEVYSHVDESNLEALAKMVQTFSGTDSDSVAEGLISWQDVYKHYVSSLLKSLESRTGTDLHIQSPDGLQSFVSKLEHTYDLSRKYIGLLTYSDGFEIMKKYFTVVVPLYGSWESVPDNSSWQECLILLLNFWIRLADEMQELTINSNSEEKSIKFNPESLMSFLKAFMRLVVEDSVSPSQGWGAVLGYLNHGFTSEVSEEIFIFCREMVLSGCGFSSVAEVFSEAVSQCLSNLSSALNTQLPDLPHLYLNILEPILQELIAETDANRNLFRLLSSLSKMENDLELLNSVRHAVWRRMAKSSDNLLLPNQVRVYVLELMQHVAGESVKGLSPELRSNVLPWEGWDASQYSAKSMTETEATNQTDSSNRFTSTLVALKSSQLVAAIDPSAEITIDDLSSADAAVSCFMRISGSASTSAHLDALLAILGEWEGLFGNNRKDEEASGEEASGWGNDDWDDEGWESFQETEKKPKEDSSVSVAHPLHACWLGIFKKLAALSRSRDILRLLDASLSKPAGTLLSEDDATTLNQTVLFTDPFLALKVALLLPYESIQLQCLVSVEESLKQGGVTEAISRDHELLTLVLSSGIVSTVVSEPIYGATFNYVCFLIGNLSRRCQESQIGGGGEGDFDFRLFKRVLFPSAVSELAMAGQEVLAGFVVTRFMHTNTSLRLINVADVSLSNFLRRQASVVKEGESGLKEGEFVLKNTVGGLRNKLPDLIQTALGSVCSEVR